MSSYNRFEAWLRGYKTIQETADKSSGIPTRKNAECPLPLQANSAARTTRISITRPLAFVDLETTGSILGLDRIIEVGVLKVMPDGQELEFETRVNPEMGITTEATRMHGITTPDVQNAPTFDIVARRLSEFLNASDLAGYLPTLKLRRHSLYVRTFVAKPPIDVTSCRLFRCLSSSVMNWSQ